MTAKVLIPIDGSEPSLRAVDFTIDIMKRTPGASLTLLHVWNVPALEVLGAVEAMDDGWMRNAEKNAADAAFETAIAKCDAAGVSYETMSRSGHVAESIEQTAGEEGTHYIVMGTRGLGGIEGLLLGSVAQQVIHLTKLPVTLIK